MDSEEFRKHAHRMADWMADYFEGIEDYPVKSRVKPGEILNRIPGAVPEKGESMERIFDDFREIIMPGMTHWQSPNYFAYFTANSSYPSVLAEMLTATLGAQCMIWETSPAAAELEERMMQWLRDMIGLPAEFEGVIQDTGSTATLVSILTAREKATDLRGNRKGLSSHPGLRVYASSEVHSSIDKAVRIAGLGQVNLVKIPVDDALAMKPDELRKAVLADLSAGLRPLCVVAALGTTGTLAMDPLGAIAKVCKEFGLWLHVDAAYAGSALVLPEYRHLIEGIEQVDTFFFNPHKWLFTNFDCCAYFVRDRGALIRTFEILPEYLKTQSRGSVNDYRDWGIQLGRRFRALKLWFVLRSFGSQGIREKISFHIGLAKKLAQKIKEHPSFELIEPQHMALVCFRYTPDGIDDPERLNELNNHILDEVNKTGKAYITHTAVNGLTTLRMVTSQTHVREENVDRAWQLIQDTAAGI